MKKNVDVWSSWLKNTTEVDKYFVNEQATFCVFSILGAMSSAF